MAYINTGYQRMTDLLINTTTNGVVTTTSLSLEQGFTQNGVVYLSVLDSDIQTMALSNYQQRVTDFSAYVQANFQTQYPGLFVITTGSYVQNTTACPLP